MTNLEKRKKGPADYFENMAVIKNGQRFSLGSFPTTEELQAYLEDDPGAVIVYLDPTISAISKAYQVLSVKTMLDSRDKLET